MPGGGGFDGHGRDRGKGRGREGGALGGGHELSFGLVEVVLVQDGGVREDVAQEPAQGRLAARGTTADADDGGLSVVVGGHRVGLFGEVRGCLVGVCGGGRGGGGWEELGGPLSGFRGCVEWQGCWLITSALRWDGPEMKYR